MNTISNFKTNTYFNVLAEKIEIFKKENNISKNVDVLKLRHVDFKMYKKWLDFRLESEDELIARSGSAMSEVTKNYCYNILTA